ncbi:MAG: PH domain-containing protein [Wenzhouxiangella sp.]|nr:PH domain-containing protein [Wenzhouxiangella sp.]
MSGETVFSNRGVDATELPDYRDVALKPVVAAYLPHALLTTGGFWAVVVLIALVAPRLPFVELDLGWWPALALVPAVWFTVLSWMDARRRGWALREHDLIYRSGVIWRKTVVVPFARIQHVETASGPLERWFGLMRVKCFTAGGMMADLTVEGLDEALAQQVRQYLLEQIRDDVEPESPPAGAVTNRTEDDPDHG